MKILAASLILLSAAIPAFAQTALPPAASTNTVPEKVAPPDQTRPTHNDPTGQPGFTGRSFVPGDPSTIDGDHQSTIHERQSPYK